jgi:uncharacterized protein YuzB (UPF0349 family)
MHGTRIEKEVEICVTNLANKTNYMNINTKKLKEDIFLYGTLQCCEAYGRK